MSAFRRWKRNPLVRFFNRAFLSRVALLGCSRQGLRFGVGHASLRSRARFNLARCRHGSEWEGEPRFWSRSSAADIRGFIQDHRPHSQHRMALRVGNELAMPLLQTRGPEVGAIHPHPVQDYRELARHRNDSAAMAADLGESQPPRLQRRPGAGTCHQGKPRVVQRHAHVAIARLGERPDCRSHPTGSAGISPKCAATVTEDRNRSDRRPRA